MSADRYPLEIRNVGEDTYIVMSKGHHAPADFMAAVREAGYRDWPLGKPTHHWVKTFPCPPSCGEHHCHYQLRDDPRKGWWPATYAHEAYGDEQYADPIPSQGTEQ